jgi:hypothetical protein
MISFETAVGSELQITSIFTASASARGPPGLEARGYTQALS